MPRINDSGGGSKPKAAKPVKVDAGSKQKGNESGAAIGTTTTTGGGTPKNEALSTGTYGSGSPEQAPNQVDWGEGTASTGGGGGGGAPKQSWQDTHTTKWESTTWAERNPGTWAERHDTRKTGGGGGGGGTRLADRSRMDGSREVDNVRSTYGYNRTDYGPGFGGLAGGTEAGGGGGGGGGTGSSTGFTSAFESIKGVDTKGKSVEEVTKFGAKRTRKTGGKKTQ